MTAPGTVLAGRYRLVNRLASGGMGSVWEAWDEVLHRTVAVKQLLHQPGLSTRDAQAAVDRAMREARITARLHHPNAVPVYDVVEQDGRPCLIMQYVPSKSLHAILSDKGVLQPAVVAGIGADIAAALAAAHQAGIVHRDVKPSNVLITEDGTAKLTDFGVSHAIGDVSLTSTGMVTGTPAFLSPEVARGAPSNAASDVFSLGATLYIALEGEPPFGSGANPMATLHRVASGQIVPPQRSGALTPLLTRMLAADPAARPAVIDVRNTLSALRDDLGSMAGATQRIGAPLAAPRAAKTAALPVAVPLRDGSATARPPLDQAAIEQAALDQAAVDQPGVNRAAFDRPPPAAPGGPSRPPRGNTPLIAAAAVLAVAAALLLGLLLLNRGNSGSNTGSRNAPTGNSTQAHPPSTSATSQPSSAPPASSTAPATSSPAASPTVQAGAPTAAQLASAISDYYALLPGNTDAGWARLTKHYQHTTAKNRDTYEAFWGSVQQVQVSNAVGVSPDRAQATLTYTYKDGHVVVERTAFRLVPDQGVLKIDASDVLSSQTQ